MFNLNLYYYMGGIDLPKFVFKLQSVLNIKQQMEDSLKNELANAVKKLEAEKDILRQIEAEMEAKIEDINSKSSKGILVEKLREYNAYIAKLKETGGVQKENINKAQQNVDKYREMLLKAVQEREMLEKLKEIKFQEYLKEQLKEEQRLNDEIASFRYNDQVAGDKNG